MSRAKKAADDKDYDLAIRMLSSIIEIKPDFTEAWNRRATIYFLKKDYTNSMADIAKVLAREPRHFGALSGLASSCKTSATTSTRWTPTARRLISIPASRAWREDQDLKEKVEGRDL